MYGDSVENPFKNNQLVPPENDSVQRDDSYADMKYVPSRKSQERGELSDDEEEVEVTKKETVNIPLHQEQRPGFVLALDQEPDISRDDEEILITTTNQMVLPRYEDAEGEEEEGIEVVFDHRAQDSDRKLVENDLYDEEIEVEYFNRPAQSGEEEQQGEEEQRDEEEQEDSQPGQKRIIKFGREESDEDDYAEEEQQNEEAEDDVEEEREAQLEN